MSEVELLVRVFERASNVPAGAEGLCFVAQMELAVLAEDGSDARWRQLAAGNVTAAEARCAAPRSSNRQASVRRRSAGKRLEMLFRLPFATLGRGQRSRMAACSCKAVANYLQAYSDANAQTAANARSNWMPS